MFTLFFVANGENKVAQANFEKLARSFETETDIGACDDAGLAAKIAFLGAGFGGSEEELAVQELECHAHIGGEIGNEWWL